MSKVRKLKDGGNAVVYEGGDILEELIWPSYLNQLRGKYETMKSLPEEARKELLEAVKKELENIHTDDDEIYGNAAMNILWDTVDSTMRRPKIECIGNIKDNPEILQ